MPSPPQNTPPPNEKPEVAVIMGSASDMPTMQAACDTLKELSIAYEVQIVSAHRTPEHMLNYAQQASSRGVKIIVAAAGGAAHLPGMIAATTTLPVIGVPIKTKHAALDGLDAMLSILQMPAGVPVATVALNGAQNAALLAAQILSLHNDNLKQKLQLHKKTLSDKVQKQNESLKLKP